MGSWGATGFGIQIPILASVETVWSLLTDAAGYPAWNSTVTGIDGQIAAGETIRLHAKPVGPAKRAGRAFPLRVSAFEAPSRMVWTGGVPLGLLTGTRTFGVVPAADIGVLFSMDERFTGLMAWLIPRAMPKMLPALYAFANDLKLAAERAG